MTIIGRKWQRETTDAGVILKVICDFFDRFSAALRKGGSQVSFLRIKIMPMSLRRAD